MIIKYGTGILLTHVKYSFESQYTPAVEKWSEPVKSTLW